METPVRKVITASAGTGKTYRLSLEYINLLLQYRKYEFGFDEILVITFTRKATSEIRSAIFEHLKDLLSQTGKGKILQNNLENLFGLKIGEDELAYLKSLYEQMLVNKHKLQISTIDSFVHAVFKAVIAPYIGITGFQIDNEINKKYLPDIYNHIFRDNTDTEAFIRIFHTAGKNSIEHYDNLILSIIANRWLLQMIKDKERTDVSGETGFKAEEYLTEFTERYKELLNEVKDYLLSSEDFNSPAGQAIMKDYCKIVSSDSVGSFLADYSHLVGNERFIAENWKTLSKDLRFWKSPKIKDKILKEKFQSTADELRQVFCNYIFYKYLVKEEEEIMRLADHILGEYDRLKMRDKIFTYSDISYYTFQYLYDEALSLVDPLTGSVSNRFYEYLTARTRFILIDEFQDTGIVQHKLLFPIISEIVSGSGSKEYGGVIIVGDEKQSIYGWRSGERDLLLNMPSILNIEGSVELKTTYRSSKFIIDFINDIFLNVSQRSGQYGLDWYYAGDIDSASKSKEGFLGFYFMNKSRSLPGISEVEIPDPYREFVETTLLPLYEQKQIEPADSVVLARNNKHLEEIARILEENGIEYFLESSFSFLQHRIIKPIIHLLRYLSEHDILHLLRFFRSDYCLLPTSELKEVILLARGAKEQKKDILISLGDSFPEESIIGKTVRIIKNHKPSDLPVTIAAIIREFNVTKLFSEDHNIKNLHLFMETVSQFLSDTGIDYPRNINGLMLYLSDNEKNEDFRQASIDNIDSLQLMTIHKAKGLEFGHVFLYYEISLKGGNRSGSLEYLYRFNDLFTELEDERVSYNYSSLLKEMDYPLMAEHDRRELLEDINNIYVALTRAKRNISLFMVYENVKGLMEAAKFTPKEEKSELPNVRKIFLSTLIDYLQLDRDSLKESGELNSILIRREIGSLPSFEVREEQKPDEKNDFDQYFNIERGKLLCQPDLKKDAFLNFRTVYLENKQILYGDLVHYYLSFIFYADDKEQRYAMKRTIQRFGNLVTEDEIRRIINTTNSFIAKNKSCFDKKWDRIFTEQTVFDKSGREFRIDRMLVNEREKKILLIDFKTGSLKDLEQLERYKNIVADLPPVSGNRYSIETKYLEILL